MFKVPNQYRNKNHPLLGSDDSLGNNGYFIIPLEKCVFAHVIVSDGKGWEHVSVHVDDDGENATPLWEEMCKIKDLFWDKEDTVVQFHPPEKEYVNMHKDTLHLWKPIGYDIKTPPSILVGLKKK
jgi:hypothetical protein